MKKNVNIIVVAGLLCALDVVCTRFLSFYTPGRVDRISMQFLPNALSGMFFGPALGALVCAAGDIFGMLINSGGMVFTPLITLACALRGLVYGLLLYRKNLSLTRCVAAVAVVTVAVELGYMPAALAQLYGSAWQAIILGKLVTRIITIPVYGFIMFTVTKALYRAGLPGLRGLPAARKY